MEYALAGEHLVHVARDGVYLAVMYYETVRVRTFP